MSDARRRPTRRQLEVLRAYIRAGSVVAAAYELGISETTVRQHLSGLYRRTGCVNAAQAVYWLGSGQLGGGHIDAAIHGVGNVPSARTEDPSRNPGRAGAGLRG